MVSYLLSRLAGCQCCCSGLGGGVADGILDLLGGGGQAFGHVLEQLGGLGVLGDLRLDGVGQVL